MFKHNIQKIGDFHRMNSNNDGREDTRMARCHSFHMSSTLLAVILMILVVGLLNSSIVFYQIFTLVGTVIGYYAYAMIVLWIMMLLHYTENPVARFLMTLCEPTFKWVGEHITYHFAMRTRVWLCPLVSIVLVMVVQKVLMLI